MDLFTLAGKLTLDSSSFDSGVTKASNAGEKLKKGLDSVKKVAVAVAGTAVLGKLTSSVKKFADQAAAAGDKIDKQSQALGISRKAYQEWDYILSQSGSSIDSLGTSMKTLNNAILGGKDSITKLGLSFDDLNAMSMEDQFEAVVRAFQQMPESAEKSALAVELFGKNGQSLLPLLNSTSDSLDEMRQRFADLGIEMSDEQIDAAVNYSDAVDQLKRTFEAIGIAIGTEFLPMLTEWASGIATFVGSLLAAYKENGFEGLFTELSNQIDGFITGLQDSGNPVLEKLGEVLNVVKEALGVVVGLFTDFDGTVKKLKSSDAWPLQLLGTALEWVKDALIWIDENQEFVIAAIGAIIGAFAVAELISFLSNLNPIVLALEGLAALAALIMTNWDGIQKFFEDLWTAVKTAVENAWKAVEEWWGDIESFISAAWSTISGWFETNVWNPISEAFTAFWGIVTQLWTGIETAISNAWTTVWSWLKENVWDKIVEFFSPMWETVQAFWNDPLGAITAAWNQVAGWIESSVTGPIISAWNAVKSAIQGAIDAALSFLGINSGGSSGGSKGTVNSEAVMAELNRMEQNGVSVADRNQWLKDQGMYYNTATKGFEWIPNNSNAKGNWNVPYDDYLSRLHRGEMVLTASQARQYREGEGEASRAVVAAIQGLRNDLNNLKLMVGEKVFGEAVVDYGGRNMSDYIGGVESSQAYGYGT